MTYQDFIREWRSDSDVCMVSTSGSTGTPKIIPIPKSVMRESALRTIRHFNLRPGDRIHSCISPDFIGGKMMAVRAEIGGLRLTWEQPSNRPKVISEFLSAKDSKIPALIALVPSQIIEPLRDGIPENFSSTRWLIGGSSINPDLRKEIVESGIEAWESYGMTETASHIALRRVSLSPTPFFKPLPGFILSTDPRGCLCIKDSQIDIITNDIVDLQADGSFQILGRADNVIITGGKKVQPERVEALISPYLTRLGITACMLGSAPDFKWGDRLILYLETSRRDRAIIDEADRIAHSLLSPHEVPKEIICVSSLPRTANGKLQRFGKKVAQIN